MTTSDNICDFCKVNSGYNYYSGTDPVTGKAGLSFCMCEDCHMGLDRVRQVPIADHRPKKTEDTEYLRSFIGDLRKANKSLLLENAMLIKSISTTAKKLGWSDDMNCTPWDWLESETAVPSEKYQGKRGHLNWSKWSG